MNTQPMIKRIAFPVAVAAVAAALAFGSAGHASAALFTETTDAGELIDTATDVGAGIDQITGSNATGGTIGEIDVFKLTLGAGLFEAEVTAQGNNQALVLFDGSGLGLRADDDSGGSCVFCPKLSETISNGIFYIAIFPIINYIGPFATTGDIWFDILLDINSTPDDSGASDPWIGWSPFVDVLDFGGTYTIQLNQTTVTAPGTSPVPEPATIALFGFGLAGLGLMRRRRAA